MDVDRGWRLVSIGLEGQPADVLEHGGKVLLLERGAFDGVHAAMTARLSR